jgi:hypothetical protein
LGYRSAGSERVMGIESNPRNRRLDSRGAGLRQPSNSWIEYDGISRHKKLLDSNANFEEFEVDGHDKGQHIKAQTLTVG